MELDAALWEQVQQIAQAQKWPRDDAILILLGYGAAVHAPTSAGDPVDALGAARAEVARLRHRVFSATEAVRDLQMNITGLTASIQQAQKSLVTLEQIVADLKRQAARDLTKG